MPSLKKVSMDLAFTLVSTSVLVGIAYQTLAANDEHQAAQIDKIAAYQEASSEKVTAIQIDIARLVVNQEHAQQDGQAIIQLLEEVVSISREAND